MSSERPSRKSVPGSTVLQRCIMFLFMYAARFCSPHRASSTRATGSSGRRAKSRISPPRARHGHPWRQFGNMVAAHAGEAARHNRPIDIVAGDQLQRRLKASDIARLERATFSGSSFDSSDGIAAVNRQARNAALECRSHPSYSQLAAFSKLVRGEVIAHQHASSSV